jgi:hypothetical protein
MSCKYAWFDQIQKFGITDWKNDPVDLGSEHQGLSFLRVM